MQRITGYIFRQLTLGTIFVTLGLACLLWLSQSLRFIELIVKKGLSIGTFVHLTILLLPNFLVIIVPISLFAVVLFTYNRLNADRETVVLKAAGVGYFGLARAPVLLALILTAAGYGLTLYIVPKSVERFRELQWTISNDVSAVLLQDGAFTDVAPGLTVYVRARTPEGELLGVMVHDSRDPGRAVTMMAERGALVFAEKGPRVFLVNGNRQEARAGAGNLSLLYFDSYTVELGGLVGDKGDRFRDARERGIGELLTATEAEGLREIDIHRFRVEAHQRLVNPLTHLTFVMVALASLLTGPFNRRGQIVRVVVAVGIMILLEAASLGGANAATRHPAFLPVLYVLALAPIAASAYVLARQPRWLDRAPWAALTERMG